MHDDAEVHEPVLRASSSHGAEEALTESRQSMMPGFASWPDAEVLGEPDEEGANKVQGMPDAEVHALMPDASSAHWTRRW